MQVTPHVYVMHIDDDSVYHPGGSNNYFVGDPCEEMVLIDTGDQQREWTRSILAYYEHLGCPKIAAILLTHSHQDHPTMFYRGLRAIARKMLERWHIPHDAHTDHGSGLLGRALLQHLPDEPAQVADQQRFHTKGLDAQGPRFLCRD
jgi:glyoxylase-like metal-dependent hydrolase (beta-lactamase superfamily II)